ncbi:LysE family translocator [Pantoea allii]|uniref:LysE family translocator n=1 Tax=Pantoea allii TaxID=574096 RepID=A0ABS6VI95_9GAMM|nr:MULTISPECIES: LysE family transporter [Pantoea]MBW1215641.1 LysE family translocator [Pantoea allii]MBW1259062.1 LysE family translocator [Pantoea allii]MBW1268251.1 LysE family translocator [Pantoea allii]MBW1290258.1 LysE family translocator [Pantoea allii]OAE06687.1 lysine transporter LysE [Pantoea sp. OXWO6B1]
MMSFSTGFLLSLSLCLDIGIANIAMITLAMQRGYFQGFWLGVGTCVGDLIYAVLALAGMAVLLQFEVVRWIIWIGGGALLVGFTIKMLLSAFRNVNDIDTTLSAARRSMWREFRHGIVLAISSPTAILWFATVGGALISRFGQQSITGSALFLSGFFLAGIVWTAALCLVGSLGGRLLGQKLLRYSYMASALIFAYFALYVIVSGYKEFILS